MRRPSVHLLTASILSALLAGPACGAGGPECVAVHSTCTPLYAPEYAEIFERTLRPTCGQPGTSCHGVDGAQAGLVFDEADAAYTRLLEGAGNRPPVVVPGNAACSPLVVRIESTDPKRVMPPGQPLSEAVRCALEQWIDAGAPR
ncbi:MAG: hypothetical protein D6729_16050 [Deltaproteobacteria bacterium]|nr:MAG: hypothetical protein D6729_16050 [Deltaproteobacteria bacterium]